MRSFYFRPLSDADVHDQVILVAQAEEVGLEEDAGAQALVRISQGDLRKALTALQVAAALNKEKDNQRLGL